MRWLRFSLVLSCFMLLGGLFASASYAATTVFKDGFESGSLTAWTNSGGTGCQWPSVSPHRWPLNSPLVAIVSPRWWPSDLPTRGRRFSPAGVGSGSGEGLHPLAGGRLGESVALLAVGDHRGNATLNYRGVLARELTAEDAEIYRRPGHRRRLRRVSAAGEGPESV